MENPNHKTALVIIPPEEVWGPIQAIRQKHDKKAGRWMPHITLVYPFLERSRFGCAARGLRAACKAVKPFDVELARFTFFGGAKGYYTLWLAPEPEQSILDLHASLLGCAACEEFYSERALIHFTPHLSVGQARGMGNMVKLLEELQAGWAPIRFRVSSVHLIWRNDPPDDAFRIDRAIPLGG